MQLTIHTHLDYMFDDKTDVLLQIEAAQTSGQTVTDPTLMITPVDHFRRVPAEEGIGERSWTRVQGHVTCDYRATVTVARPSANLAALPQTPLHDLPADAVRYLMGSRYCPADDFLAFVDADFADLAGGARIAAMRDWIEDAFTYDPTGSTAQTTAMDSFVHRHGICRDYAHVLIALARAAAIPARMASVYAPGVTPPDFHAVVEVFLDGAWHLVDPTGMATPSDMAVIGVGRDAADVAFLTSWGSAQMLAQSVSVTKS
ncbi:transglutaminase family protein [Octadecabacter sp. R77987]|uniref:transglutaminase-like domain-containing protein n=1 Tax=Octadecabacter sp. R77987 TaxID=3093874 RepID=UPI00366F6D7A